MHNHFNEYANIRQLILNNNSKHVVEIGAGLGENLILLAGLRKELGFKLTSISDNTLEIEGVDSIIGVSYLEIPKLAEFDFCIVDTDHNYWTLAKELIEIDKKLSVNGIIAIHDVGMFYHYSGVCGEYFNNFTYPRKEIEPLIFTHGGLGDCLMDFLSEKRFDYKMVYFTEESSGCAVIRKVQTKEIFVFCPSLNPVYAPVGAK